MNWWYMAQTSLPDSREVAILCRVLGVSENEALGIQDSDFLESEREKGDKQ